MGVDLGGRLLWTLPMIGYVFGVMAVDHGPDYRAAYYWVPVLGSQAAALLPLIARFKTSLERQQLQPLHAHQALAATRAITCSATEVISVSPAVSAPMPPTHKPGVRKNERRGGKESPH